MECYRLHAFVINVDFHFQFVFQNQEKGRHLPHPRTNTAYHPGARSRERQEQPLPIINSTL